MATDNRRRVKLNYIAIVKALVFLVAVILAIVLLATIVKRSTAADESGTSAPSPSESTAPSESTGSEESDGTTSQVAPPTNYTFITVDNSKMYDGYLILVNNENGYSFPTDATVIESMADYKTKDYFVSDRDVSLRSFVTLRLNDMMAAFRALKNRNDIIVTDGFVDYDTQTEKYNKAVTKYGEDKTAPMVAKPGGCDAHTGMSVEFKLYTNNKFSTYDGLGDFVWIAENAHRYGFILRFPEGKELTTGMNASANKFRYVGVPHSNFMYENKLTLEEYIITVKNYRYDSLHWNCEFDGTMYEVYYYPADSGSTTSLPVPADRDYTLSGNNTDGFIVTITSN